MTVDLPRFRHLLNRLENAWRRQKAPIAEFLVPGLSEDVIEAMTAPLGLRLPVEARAWWQWQNGVDVPKERWTSEAPRLGGTDLDIISLDRAVAEYLQSRRLDEELRRRDPIFREQQLMPSPSWFPIARAPNGDVLMVDCSVPEGAPTPIRRISFGDLDFARVRLNSLTEVVELWLELLDRELWWYSRENAQWHYDVDLMDRRMRLSGVA
jgi:cell wall assembly regulator SMI1